jgi:hypothetical protein
MADNAIRLDAWVERRASRRFPIEQEAVYKTLDHKVPMPECGIGKTIDISSSGVLFETVQPLRFGKRVEVAVNWPACLDGGCLLKWVVVGRVVRVEETRAAISIDQYEFRTRRAKELPEFALDKQAPNALPYH